MSLNETTNKNLPENQGDNTNSQPENSLELKRVLPKTMAPGFIPGKNQPEKQPTTNQENWFVWLEYNQERISMTEMRDGDFPYLQGEEPNKIVSIKKYVGLSATQKVPAKDIVIKHMGVRPFKDLEDRS